MFFVISKLAFFVLNPVTWILGLLAAAYFWKKRRKLLLIFTVVLTYMLSNPFLHNEVRKMYQPVPMSVSAFDSSYEVGIVLTGMMSHDYAVGKAYYSTGSDRIIRALELLQTGKIKKLIVSGGSGSIIYKNSKEALFIDTTLRNLGIEKSKYIIEAKSRNTNENALFSKHILDSLGVKKALLITSCKHLPRAIMCFEKQGIEVVAFGVDPRISYGSYTWDKYLIPDLHIINEWKSLIKEWVGILAYKMAGYA